MIDDRVNGFLVSPMDVFGWVESMMRLAYDDRLNKR